MDIKDSYLHGTVGVVKSISVNADKLTYTLADQANTPREITLPTVTQTANGLAPKVINTNTSTIGTAYYVLASSNGSNAPSWYRLPDTAFSNTTYDVFTGASSTAAGSTGLVPAPASGYNRRYLCGDGTWKNVYELYWEKDTRNEATTPSDYKYTFKLVGIKTPSVIGLDSSIGWASVIGWKGYSDNSGPKSWELASDNRQRLHVRSGSGVQNNGSGNEDWSAWNTLAYISDNFPSNQIDKLTGYTKATALAALSVNDSLNTALGKLEYKTDFIYNDLIGGENNADVIDKWSEIKDFIAEVGNSTDITDEFVTRKTAQTITGLKTFIDNITINTTAVNKTPKLILKEHYTSTSSWISEIISDYYGRNVCTTENFTHGLYIVLGRDGFDNLNILDSTKTPIARISKEKGHWFDGTLTISGDTTAVKFITKDGTSSQFVKGDGSLDSNTYALSSSLGNYVTLTTTQTISGSKTFTSTLTTRSITPQSNNTYSLGTNDKKWASLYSTNIYSNAIYNGSSIYASGEEIIHGGSDYFELNKGYPNAIMWLNASEYKFKLGSEGVQFMIAANGNVGIGDVGGAPAYKLHIGGGDLMADTVHAWSGGFKKNGSSNDYILLGGGGHKALTALFTSLTSNSTNAISITIGGTTKSISKSTLASSLGLSDYVTALGTNGNYVTWTKNGTANNLTVPYASSSRQLVFTSAKNLQGLTCHYAGLTGSDDKTGAFVGPVTGTTTYSSILRLQSHTTDGGLYYRDLIFDVNSDRIWSRRVTNSGNPVLQSILLSRRASVQPTSTAEGWYRFATIGSTNAGTVSNCIVSIQRSYNSPENEHYIFSITNGYNGHISITQLSGYKGGQLIPKIRVVYNNSGNCYLDYYMKTGSYTNTYVVEIYSGDGTIQTPTLTTTVGGTAYEFTTVDGCKSDKGFTGNLSGAATTLSAVSVISNKKFTSLTNASWTDTGYTFTDLESGTYAVQVTSTNLVASGIMSVYKNIQDSVGDEIPLHVYGTAGWRPYLRTSANKLQISSNDVTAATNGRTVTIKIAKIL